MRGWLGDSRGFTLVETLLAGALFVMLVTSVTSVLLMGQRSSWHISNWGDRTQQLRLAARQVEEDLAFAGWDPLSSTLQKIQVKGYQPFVDKSEGDWSDLDEWPGNLVFWPEFTVEYEISSANQFIRSVYKKNMESTTVYTRQVLFSNLKTDSVLRVAAPNLVEVRLRAGAGGNRIAEAFSSFFIR